MKHCANEVCPDRLTNGVVGEYEDRVEVCPYCEQPLADGPPPLAPELEWADLALIATYFMPAEAHVARATLEAAGIPASIRDEHIISFHGFFSPAVGGVKIFVHARHEDEAKQVLEEGATTLVGDPDALDLERGVPPGALEPGAQIESRETGVYRPPPTAPTEEGVSIPRPVLAAAVAIGLFLLFRFLFGR